MSAVAHALLPADLFDDLGNDRQVDVTDPREEMVLDLMVEAAHVPGQETAPASEIRGRLHLVDGPLPARDILRLIR
jgi:hypothetical protein